MFLLSPMHLFLIWTYCFQGCRTLKHKTEYTITSTTTAYLEFPFLMPHLLCLLSSKGQQVISKTLLQGGALTESNAAGPHRVHHFTATFTQIPQMDLHVPSLTTQKDTNQRQATVSQLSSKNKNKLIQKVKLSREGAILYLMRASVACSVLTQMTELPSWPSTTFSALLEFRFQTWIAPFPELKNPAGCIMKAHTVHALLSFKAALIWYVSWYSGFNSIWRCATPLCLREQYVSHLKITEKTAAKKTCM